VVIDHGGQYATLYGHASTLYVDVGEEVSTGTTIAAVGASGLATGPHLHFEVRILGNPVDPAPYL
jgi:murein DD-endopeptidase MepM/ murein hydrolase activator NlpD